LNAKLGVYNVQFPKLIYPNLYRPPPHSYSLVVLEPGDLRGRLAGHLADDPQFPAMLDGGIIRHRGDRRDRCVLCCKKDQANY